MSGEVTFTCLLNVLSLEAAIVGRLKACCFNNIVSHIVKRIIFLIVNMTIGNKKIQKSHEKTEINSLLTIIEC